MDIIDTPFTWKRLGIVFRPDQLEWDANCCLQPTPIKIDDKIVRVYFGARDKQGVGRAAFVDLSAENPTEVVGWSKKPAFDIGIPGRFDENGIIPCAVHRRGNDIHMYYAGYQLGTKVRFTVFGGLAISKDAGVTFQRHQEIPVTDRVNGEELFRVIHTILPENNGWRVWYGGGNHFAEGVSKTLPVYDIRTMFSSDGIKFPDNGEIAILTADGEHRVGRPYVFHMQKGFGMFYGYGTEKKAYTLGYAFSPDGISWTRKDHFMKFHGEDSVYEDQMMGYPAVFQTAGKTYLLYNGNNMARDGILMAVLDS